MTRSLVLAIAISACTARAGGADPAALQPIAVDSYAMLAPVSGTRFVRIDAHGAMTIGDLVKTKSVYKLADQTSGTPVTAVELVTACRSLAAKVRDAVETDDDPLGDGPSSGRGVVLFLADQRTPARTVIDALRACGVGNLGASGDGRTIDQLQLGFPMSMSFPAKSGGHPPEPLLVVQVGADRTTLTDNVDEALRPPSAERASRDDKRALADRLAALHEIGDDVVVWPDAHATIGQLAAALIALAGDQRARHVTIADPSTHKVAADPRVHVGTPTITGNSDPKDVQRALLLHSAEIAACVPADATLHLHFFVSPNGSVSSSTVSGVTGDPRVCVQNSMSLSLPAIRGGGGATVDIDVTIAAP